MASCKDVMVQNLTGEGAVLDENLAVHLGMSCEFDWWIITMVST